MTNAVFENCGYYKNDSNSGCGNDDDTGCSDGSTVFGLLTHSDEFTPEIMQATKGIEYKDCGRRFKLTSGKTDTVSARGQNWLDADGTASGLMEPTFIASGLASVKDWWGVDDQGKESNAFLQYLNLLRRCFL